MQNQSLEHFYDGRFLNVDYNLRDLTFQGWPSGREEACVKWVKGGERLLEVGFGDGNLLYTLSKNFARVDGIEISKNRIGPMSEAFRRAHCQNVYLGAANVEQSLPFEDQTFDWVLWLDVIEHVIDVHAALNEIYRVLKKGGKLITSTPNIAELRRRIKLLGGKFPSTACEENEGVDLALREPYDRGHLHYFSHSSLALLYKCHGFRVLDYHGFGKLGRLHNLRPSLLCGTVFMIGEKL